MARTQTGRVAKGVDVKSQTQPLNNSKNNKNKWQIVTNVLMFFIGLRSYKSTLLS
jgi:hypothetical protein